MPIEIRELIIKTHVENEHNAESFAGAESPGAAENITDTEMIVKICVERVLEILKEKDVR